MKDGLRILIISQGLPFPVYQDGATLRLYHLTRELSRNHSCRLVALDYLGAEDKLVEEVKEFVSSEVYRCNEVKGVLSNLRKLVFKERFYSKEFLVAVRRNVLDFKPDIVMAENTFMSQYHEAFKDVPCVMSAVDAIALAAVRLGNASASWGGKALWRHIARQRAAIERKYFPRFGKIIAVGKEDGNCIERNTGRPVDVIPNGVDTVFFARRSEGPSSDMIVFSGHLGSKMNQEAVAFLVKCLSPKLKESRSGFKLRIVGRSIPASLMCSSGPEVEFLSDVADIRSAIQIASLFVCPIEFGTGIKNNVLQAMSVGLPVLVTPLIAEPIGITDGVDGFVSPMGAEFVERAEALLSDSLELDQVGMAGREKIVREFSWSSVAARYVQVFQLAIEEKDGIAERQRPRKTGR